MVAARTVPRQAETVLIERLVAEGSPRSEGEDEAHIQRLVEAEWPLPPILVHRATMRIVDGFHRVAAAVRLGHAEIEAHLLDGSFEAAFVTAVETNVIHGLPLSLADRRAAAKTILTTHPQWSDRAVAKSTGLSAKTIATLRCASGDDLQWTTRLGRDGRVRPLNTADGRQLAAEIITARPEASLREIAEATGISPGTVRDVRLRLSRGEDPVAPRKQPNTEAGQRRKGLRERVPVPADVQPVLVTLSRDPAMRMNANNRDLLRWLHGHAVSSLELGDAVPGHCVQHLIEFANRCSENWAKIAEDLSDHTERQQVHHLRAQDAEPSVRKCG